MKPSLILVFIFLISPFLYSQKTIPVISVDLDGEQFKESLPFDQKFKIESFETQFDEMTLSYGIKEKEKSKSQKHYFTGQNNIKLKIKRIDSDRNKAIIPEILGPLHPNVDYEFLFTVKRPLNIGEEKRQEFKILSTEIIKTHFKDNKSVTVRDFENIKGEITGLFVEMAGTKSFYDKDDNPIDLTTLPAYRTFLNRPLNDLNSNYRDKNDEYERIEENADDIISIINNHKLLELAENNDWNNKLSEDSEDKLNEKLNSPLNPDLTYSGLIRLIKENKDFFEEVLKENYRIRDGFLVQPTDSGNEPADEFTINILIQFFDILGELADKNSNPIFNSTGINNVINYLNEHNTNLIRLREYDNKIDRLSEEIPDILFGAFIKEEISIPEIITFDVVSQESPYFGLDAGLAYGFVPNVLFAYEGVNFYFKPINRNTPLSYYENGDWFWKRFSIYLGMAQALTDEPNDFEPLFGNNSLMFGGGLRFTPVLRLNAGGLLYKKVNPNPLIDSKKTKITPTLSLSIDLDLIQIIGALGGILNLSAS